MSVKCAYHPDRAALSSCTECNTPVCRECETLIKGKPVCQRCVANIKAKVEAELGTPAAPVAAAVPPAGASPYDTTYGSPAGATHSGRVGSQGTVYTPPSPLVEEVDGPGRLLLGLLAATIVATVGSVIILKIHFHVNFMLSWVYVLLGGGVGVACATVGKSPGFVSGFFSAIATMVGLLVGHIVLALDVLKRDRPDLSLTPDIFMEVMKIFSPLHWIFVVIGIGVAFTAGMKEPGSE
jgi:hypothetical protein